MIDTPQNTDNATPQKKETDIGFYGSLFASVSFPASTPKKRYWTRTNGRDTLIIEAGTAPKLHRKKLVLDENGNQIRETLLVPAGIIPRHIMLYLSYVWIIKRQEGELSKTINLGGSLGEFLKRINMTKGGKQYDLLLRQVRRLFNCRIGTTKETDRGFVEQQPKPIIEKYDLWWSEKQPDQQTIMPSSITISDNLAAILDKSFPLNLETVRAIGRNVLAFDLYSWLTLRHYSTVRQTTITFEKLHEQFGSAYKEIRNFKPELKKAFNLIHKYYEHNSIISDKGIQLRRSLPDIDPKNMSSEKSRQYLIDLGIDPPVENSG